MIRPGLRFPLRWRLTILYGAAFFGTGALLLAVNYAFVRHNLQQQTLTFVVPEGRLSEKDLEELSGRASEYQHNLQTETLEQLFRQSLFALIMMGIAAGLLGYLVADRALAPLGDITTAARRVAAGQLSQRIAHSGPNDEIKELADTFDEMVARLERAFAAQRRFVAHASHELRTPLAMERTLLEVALANPDASSDLQETGEKLLEVNRRNEELITGLLLLARSERELVETEHVDLTAVCEHAMDVVSPEFTAAEVSLRSSLAPLTIVGSAVLLDRLVTNLLQNAARHNVPGGWAELSVQPLPLSAAPQGRPTMALLEVSNTGAEIPEIEIPRLFEPFQSLSEVPGSRSGPTRVRGSGLGLSIVRAIAATHGGEVRAFPRDGGGLVVQVRIALAPPTAADSLHSP